MKKLLFTLLVLPTLAQATCMLEVTRCETSNKFQNIYQIEKVSCSPPGGPVHVTEKLQIFNPLVNDCGPVPTRGCMKPIVERDFNTTRHFYLQADIKTVGRRSFIKIDDRKFLQQGDFHISTPKNDYMLLDGYRCSKRHN